MATIATPAPVVLAADGTTSSEGALRYAVQEASVRRVDLRIVHVTSTDLRFLQVPPTASTDVKAHARRILYRAASKARGLAPDLEVHTAVGRGDRARSIVNSSADAQLVVVGRETRHGLERVLTGATTAGVTSHARCPVVVVPSDWRPHRAAGSGGSVVVGVRRVADGPDLMATAYAWARPRGAAITVVHAWEMPDPYLDRIETRTYGDEWHALGERLLDEALGDSHDQYPDVRVDTRVVHGHPASVLATAARAADLLVVRRTHERRPFDHLGATVRALLLASPAPVEVVPATRVRNRSRSSYSRSLAVV